MQWLVIVLQNSLPVGPGVCDIGAVVQHALVVLHWSQFQAHFP